MDFFLSFSNDWFIGTLTPNSWPSDYHSITQAQFCFGAKQISSRETCTLMARALRYVIVTECLNGKKPLRDLICHFSQHSVPTSAEVWNPLFPPVSTPPLLPLELLLSPLSSVPVSFFFLYVLFPIKPPRLLFISKSNLSFGTPDEIPSMVSTALRIIPQSLFVLHSSINSASQLIQSLLLH